MHTFSCYRGRPVNETRTGWASGWLVVAIGMSWLLKFSFLFTFFLLFYFGCQLLTS